jgi:hypothetical protein
MTLALSLAKEGSILPSIYELYEEGDNRGTNIALALNGLRVLDHISVYNQIRTKGFNFESVTIYSTRG